MPIRRDDKFQIVKTTGGGKIEEYTVDEVDTALNLDENAKITALQEQVGDYNPTSTGSTITADLSAAEGDIDDLEAQVGDYNPTSTGSTITADLSAAEGDIDDLEAKQATSGAPVAPVTAKLKTGADDSEIDWEADTAGTAGNSISLTFEVPATKLSVAPNTAASEIILTAKKGVHPVSITLLGGESQELAVTASGSAITVQLATDAGSVVTSTAANVLAAILAEMEGAKQLDGLISSAVAGASYVGETLYLAQAIDYFDYTDGVSVDVTTPTDIIVSVDYDGATDLPTSTANEVLAAVNLASDLVTGTAGKEGTDPVAEMAADNLKGGVNGTAGVDGAIRYETGKLWISVGTSTISESKWEYASLA